MFLDFIGGGNWAAFGLYSLLKRGAGGAIRGAVVIGRFHAAFEVGHYNLCVFLWPHVNAKQEGKRHEHLSKILFPLH